MSFHRILCAVDFSAGSLEAFRVAVELARLHGAALHLFHSIEALPTLTSAALIELTREANTAVEKLAAQAQDALDAGVLTTEVASGRAFVEIVNRAREWRADLVVLGAKGATGLEDIFLGGTAESVLKEAPCSVLAARSGP